MLNTIRMDLYHTFKSKSFYITILIAVISVFFSVAGMKFTIEDKAITISKDSTENNMFQNIGISLGSSGELHGDDTSIDDIVVVIAGTGSLLIMGAMFCTIFVSSDHSTGYIKNVISRKNYRMQTSISKAIIMAVYTLIEIIVCFVGLLFASLIFFHKININDIGSIIGYLGTQSIIQIALLTLCILVCNLFRNVAAAMAFTICLCVGLFSIITQLIDHLKLPFMVNDYLLSSMVKTLPLQYNQTLYLRAIVVSLISIVVYQLGSTVVMNRQDIK